MKKKKLIDKKKYSYMMIVALLLLISQLGFSAKSKGMLTGEGQSGGLYKQQTQTNNTNKTGGLRAIVDGDEDPLPGGSGGEEDEGGFNDAPAGEGYMAILITAAGYMIYLNRKKINRDELKHGIQR